jgi:hypothetical protein
MEELTQGFNPITIAIFTYIVYQFKAIPVFIWEQIKKRLVYRVNIEETTELYNYFEIWLRSKYPDKYRNVEATLEGKRSFRYSEMINNASDKNKKDAVKYWHFSDLFIVNYKGKRLTIEKGRDKLDHASTVSSLFYNSYKISGLNGKKKIEMLINEVIEYNQQFKTVNPPCIYTNTSYGEWINIGNVKGKNLDNIIFGQKSRLVEDLDRFMNSEEWYNKRAIPYKRGYLLYGPPGNGKSSTIMSVAAKYHKDLYLLNLNDIKEDNSLKFLFARLGDNAILSMEDIDLSVTGEDKENKKVSESAILNCLDGAFSKHGLIVFITTNNKEKLNPALIREGRADLKLEITNPGPVEVKEYLDVFYDSKFCSVPNIDWTYQPKLSMVEVQNICIENKADVWKSIEVIKNKTN